MLLAVPFSLKSFGVQLGNNEIPKENCRDGAQGGEDYEFCCIRGVAVIFGSEHARGGSCWHRCQKDGDTSGYVSDWNDLAYPKE